MGKSYPVKYVVEFCDNGGPSVGMKQVHWDNHERVVHVQAWNSKTYGAPNEKNLEQWRVKFNKSYKYGGVNYFHSIARGVLIHISRARIVEQKTGRVLCQTVMPIFEVI